MRGTARRATAPAPRDRAGWRWTSATFDTSRSRSSTDFRVSRTLPRSAARNASSSTASSRSRIGSSATSGASSQARSSRPPIGVTVRSISSSSEPRAAALGATRPPRGGGASSDRRAAPAGSRTRHACARGPDRPSACRAGSAPGHPAADTARGRPSRPKPCRPATRSCSHKVRGSAARVERPAVHGRHGDARRCGRRQRRVHVHAGGRRRSREAPARPLRRRAPGARRCRGTRRSGTRRSTDRAAPRPAGACGPGGRSSPATASRNDGSRASR